MRRSPWMRKKESTLPLASLLRIWQRHLKETAIILAACLPWQSSLGALLGWMQQQPVNSSSRTYQEKGSPGGEWQSLIPLGWCRDQLRVSRQSCVIHYQHLHEEMKGSERRISLPARKHPAAHTDADVRGTHPPASPSPDPAGRHGCCARQRAPRFNNTWGFFSSFLVSVFSLTVSPG